MADDVIDSIKFCFPLALSESCCAFSAPIMSEISALGVVVAAFLWTPHSLFPWWWMKLRATLYWLYRRTDSVCHHTLIRTVEAEIQFFHHSTTLSNIQQEYGECEWRRKLFSSAQAQRQEEKKLLTSQLIDFRELNCTFRSSTRSQTVLALPFHLLQHKFVPEMHYFLRLSAIFTCWWFQYFFASHSHGTKILQRDGDDHLHSTTLAYGQTASKVLQRSEASTVCSFWDFHEGQKGKERWEKCCARE